MLLAGLISSCHWGAVGLSRDLDLPLRRAFLGLPWAWSSFAAAPLSYSWVSSTTGGCWSCLVTLDLSRLGRLILGRLCDLRTLIASSMFCSCWSGGRRARLPIWWLSSDVGFGALTAALVPAGSRGCGMVEPCPPSPPYPASGWWLVALTLASLGKRCTLPWASSRSERQLRNAHPPPSTCVHRHTSWGCSSVPGPPVTPWVWGTK